MQSLAIPHLLLLLQDEDGEGNDSGDNDKTADIYPGNQTICQSQSDGIVLYSMDNYEGKTVDAVKAEDFDQILTMKQI